MLLFLLPNSRLFQFMRILYNAHVQKQCLLESKAPLIVFQAYLL